MGFDQTQNSNLRAPLKGLLKSYRMHILVLKLVTLNSNYKLSKLATESAHVLTTASVQHKFQTPIT